MVVLFAGIILAKFHPAHETALGQTLSSTTCPTFQEILPMLGGRDQLAAVNINVDGQNFIYAVGGRDPSKMVANTVFYTRILTDGQIGNWKIKSNAFATGFKYSALVADDDNDWLYVLGGNDGSHALDSIYQAQPSPATGDATWVPAVVSLPVSVYLHAAVLLGERIYVIGGQHDGSPISPAIADVDSFLILGGGALSGWESENSLASLAADGIWAHAAVASEEYQCIYVVGGWLGSIALGGPHNKVFRACIEGSGKLGAWEEESEALPLVPTSAVGIYYHSAAIVDDKVFVIGGTAYKSGSPEPTDSVYVGYINTSGHLGNWTACVHCLPANLERQGVAVASDGPLYVIGGRNRSDGSIYDTVLFTPLAFLTKSHDPQGEVTYGDTITHTVAYANNGLRDLSGVFITDTVPHNTRLLAVSGRPVAESVSWIQNNVTVTVGGINAGSVITWDSGTLPITSSGQVSLVIQVVPPEVAALSGGAQPLAGSYTGVQATLPGWFAASCTNPLQVTATHSPRVGAKMACGSHRVSQDGFSGCVSTMRPCPIQSPVYRSMAHGAYSLTITNPGGVDSLNTMTSAVTMRLAALSVDSVTPTVVCDDEATPIEIRGNDFVITPSVYLGTTPLEVTCFTSTTIEAAVLGAMEAKPYTLTVISGECMTLTNALTVVHAPLEVTDVQPGWGVNDRPTLITTRGANLRSIPTLMLEDVALSSVVYLSPTAVTAVVPPGLAPGYYELTVINPAPCPRSVTMRAAFRVIAPSPVIITNVAYFCSDQTGCVPSNPVINTPYRVYLPLIAKSYTAP